MPPPFPPDNSPPPPLRRPAEPPPIASGDDAATATGPATTAKSADDVAPTPAPAPFFWRALAYILDWLLASVVFLALLNWVVLPNFGDGIAAFEGWLTTFWHDYQQIFLRPSNEIWASYNALMEKTAAALPAAVTEMLAQIGLIQVLYFWAYFFTTEYFSHGYSFGKKIFHLRTASTWDMGAPGLFDSLVRAAWKAAFFCSPSLVLLLIGVIDAHIPLFNAHRRSWHDMLSHTVVVDDNTSPLDSGGNPEDADDNGNGSNNNNGKKPPPNLFDEDEFP
jgi:uncharacterized RDD family membrane protein YckC